MGAARVSATARCARSPTARSRRSSRPTLPHAASTSTTSRASSTSTSRPTARTTCTARAAPHAPVHRGIVVSLVANHQARDARRLQRAAGITADLVHPPADAIGIARPVLAKPAPRSHEPHRNGRPSGRRGPQTARARGAATTAQPPPRRVAARTARLRGDRERFGLARRAAMRRPAAPMRSMRSTSAARACSASGVRPSSPSTFQCRSTTGTRICS